MLLSDVAEAADLMSQCPIKAKLICFAHISQVSVSARLFGLLLCKFHVFPKKKSHRGRLFREALNCAAQFKASQNDTVGKTYIKLELCSRVPATVSKAF